MTPHDEMSTRLPSGPAEAAWPVGPSEQIVTNGWGGQAGLVVAVPLLVDHPRASALSQPITTGIPFPKGFLTDPESLALRSPGRERADLQTTVLARWSDGSVKWLLLDSVLGPAEQGRSRWTIAPNLGGGGRWPSPLLVRECPGYIEVETGPATFHVFRGNIPGLARVVIDSVDQLDGNGARFLLTDPRGKQGRPRVDRVEIEARGPVRATVRFEGQFEGRVPCRFVARLCFFAGTGLVRVRFTLHNPERARHPGGLWDLGDPGSMLFRDLTLELNLKDPVGAEVTWTAGPGEPAGVAGPWESVKIYQDSSGGENWQSRNHVNRYGRVPMSFCGYRLRHEGREQYGLRANPVVSVRGPSGTVTAAIPEFWQQFPKAIEADGCHLRLRLFPGQFGDLFELQGGEQKTHTAWLHFEPPGEQTGQTPWASLDWVHQPAHIRATPDWYAGSGTIPRLLSESAGSSDQLGTLLKEGLEGEEGFEARREVIDEYGWRHFGEVYADHEQEYYDGTLPAISHYNNQYDMVLGGLLQYLRTGNVRWFDLFDPLARHVIDIDIYHTNRDRTAYNGGLFWFTDHYKSAETCTHRTYSRRNCQPGDRSYGGGPSSNHNFTTGLLHYYYLTGTPEARAAVIGLADWVLHMDDGRRTVLGLLDDGPTGLSSVTGTVDYHGPGRGGGNSINALLDAWPLTGDRRYLDGAEALIRRCIHPNDDVTARNLLNVEKRWSYTVFLASLARYLDVKAEASEFDAMYAYAQSSLVLYARWMLEHEVPYFDRPEQLEYPTEAWAAQEFRKANVLRLAAEHVDDALRSDFARRGDELAERAWADLMRFKSRGSARAIAILMVEGTLDTFFRAQLPRRAPQPLGMHEFGSPAIFIPQKVRVLNQLRTIRGLIKSLACLVDVRRWRRWLVGKAA